MKYAQIFLFLLFTHAYQKIQSEKALVIAPVTDLITDPITGYKNKKCFSYETLPLESKKGSSYCKRINQAIFNETIEIVETMHKEIKVEILNGFYQNKNKDNNVTYWAQKKDFIPYKKLINKGININLIPHPINYKNDLTEKTEIHKDIITLKLPFFDAKTGQTFSAGTRFVKVKSQQSKEHLNQNINVYIFDKKTVTFKETLIPKKLCMSNRKKTNIQKREAFLDIIKQWAHLQNGFIPYVWGGCSFTETCKNNNIIENKDLRIYKRPDFLSNPIPGLDCSGLVLRAAQICDIPYFYKNTETIRKHLSIIKKINDLKNGDLLVYTGHVIIISDKKNNKIIEARTNEYGCGKIQEIDLHNAFKDIHTFQDLFALQEKKKTLKRIDLNGKIVQNIKDSNFLCLL